MNFRRIYFILLIGLIGAVMILPFQIGEFQTLSPQKNKLPFNTTPIQPFNISSPGIPQPANAPQISLDSPANNSEIQSSSSIEFSVVSDGNPVDKVWYNWNSVSNSTLTQYSISSSGLTEGKNILNIYANSTLGEISSESFQFIIDDTEPTIKLESPLNRTEIQTGSEISISVNESNTIQQLYYNWDGQNNVALVGGSPYSIIVTPSSEISHILHVWCRDNADNQIHEWYNFTIDNTAPVSSLVGNGHCKNGQNLSITINDANTLRNVNYSWDTDSTFYSLNSSNIIPVQNLTLGDHSLHIYSTDEAENQNHQIFPILVDETAPFISLVSQNETRNEQLITLSIYDESSINQTLYSWDSGQNSSLILQNPNYTLNITGLSEGLHTLWIFAQDELGTWGNANFSIQIDETPPQTTLDWPSQNSVITMGSWINLSVSDDHNLNSVKYSWDSGSQTIINAPYDLLVGSLSEGVHLIHIFAEDLAGNLNETIFSFEYDHLAPSIVLLDDPFIIPGQSLHLNITDVHSLQQVKYNWDGGFNTTYTVLQNPFEILIPKNISDFYEGIHPLLIYAWDLVGNLAIKSFEIHIDETPPSVTLITPQDGSLIRNGMNVILNITDNDENAISLVQYNWDGAPNSTQSLDGQDLDNFLLPVNLTGEGNHIISVFVWDQAGNMQTVVYSFELDNISPVIEIVSPQLTPLGALELKPGRIILFNFTDLHNVSLTEYSWDQNNYHIFTGTTLTISDISEGTHTLSIRATDEIGNSALFSIQVIIDITAPTFEFPLNNITKPANLVDLTVNEAHTVINMSYSWDNIPFQELTESLNFPSILVANLSEGIHNLTVYVEDAAGNNVTLQSSFIFDETVPDVAILSPELSLPYQLGVILNISIQDNNEIDEVYYAWNSSPESTLPFNSMLGFYQLIADNLQEGSNTLYLAARDMAGNWGNESFILIIDITAPNINLTSLENEAYLLPNTSIQVSIADLFPDNVSYVWDINFNTAINRTANSTSNQTSHEPQSWSSPYITLLPSLTGFHELTVYAQDLAGNFAQVTFRFFTDDIPPTIALYDSSQKSNLNSGSSIRLLILDNHNISQVFFHWDSGDNQTLDIPYEVTIPSSTGKHILHIYARDVAGNWQETAFEFHTNLKAWHWILISISCLALFSGVGYIFLKKRKKEQQADQQLANWLKTHGFDMNSENP